MGSPRPNPVSDPSPPITRWHGMRIGTGFEPTAPPTARAAFGLPMEAASSRYETVFPDGIAQSLFHTFSWKGVPARSNAGKRRDRPEAYACNAAAARARGAG